MTKYKNKKKRKKQKQKQNIIEYTKEGDERKRNVEGI